jgi:hypothetical protein
MRSRIAILSLVLVAIVASVPLWGPGIVNTRGGGDSPFLLQRTHQMTANLRAGVFPVRWMPDAAYGLGYPFFHYYAALPYYLAGLLVLTGIDILTAVKTVQTLGFVAAALAMYGWLLQQTGRRWIAWLAAVAYSCAPFHLVNVYVRGDSLSEFYAFIFYPLILWSLDCIQECSGRHRTWRVGAAALAYAGLILSHNISAFIFSPFALLYVVLLAFRKRSNRKLSFVLRCLSLGTGVLLAAWFWLPAVLETDLVQLGPSTEGYFHYSRHFRAFDLVQPGFLFDYATPSASDTVSPFAMGLPQAILAALGAIVLGARTLRGQPTPHGWFILAGLAVSTAMITPLSQPLWEHLPLLPLVQFPWRFLSIQSLFASAAIASVLLVTPRKAIVAAALAALLTAAVLAPLHPERLLVGPQDVSPERLQLYELFSGNIGTTIRYEWLPNTVVPRPFTSDAVLEPSSPPRAIPLEGGFEQAEMLQKTPTQQTWQLDGRGGDIAFPLLYWPGWTAQIDGERVAVWAAKSSGYVAVSVPPGAHTVTLRLGATTVREVAAILSLATVLVLGMAIIRSRPKSGNGHSGPGRRTAWLLAASAAAVLACWAVLRSVPSPDFTSSGDLTMDFEQMPYLHHNPGGIDFETALLSSYALSTETVTPGDTTTVTLDWARVNEPAVVSVALVSPASVRQDLDALVEVTATVRAPGTTGLKLQPPADTPRGTYFLRLAMRAPSGELRAATQSGHKRGVLHLRPVWVTTGPPVPEDEPVLAYFGPRVRLHRAEVQQPRPGQLAVKLAWSTAEPLPSNYSVSLRLVDASGQNRLAFDTQPGYGFLPTSSWRPGELITDRYLLSLPHDLEPQTPYYLTVLLYESPSLLPLGQADLGDFSIPVDGVFEAHPQPRQFALPKVPHKLDVDFSGQIRLLGYDLRQSSQELNVDLWWQAGDTRLADYTVFIHLLDPGADTIAVQTDSTPRNGAYPTSWWARGEVVSDTLTLPLQNVPSGTYILVTGLYDNMLARLQAIGPDGRRVPDDRAALTQVEVGIH